ncbi:MAG: hypothetical protein LC739_06375 [Actinobacteria bacterium]|nr:hypothetical protein [Actinomycetota bacterium]
MVTRHPQRPPVVHTARNRLVVAGFAALVISGTVIATAWDDEAALGAPRYWPWLLTALQVLALWSVGAGQWWGWLLGGSVQLPWIAYAVMTTQLGFIPGCVVSAAIQTYSFLRDEMGGRPQVMPRLKPSSGRTKEVVT